MFVTNSNNIVIKVNDEIDVTKLVNCIVSDKVKGFNYVTYEDNCIIDDGAVILLRNCDVEKELSNYER